MSESDGTENKMIVGEVTAPDRRKVIMQLAVAAVILIVAIIGARAWLNYRHELSQDPAQYKSLLTIVEQMENKRQYTEAAQELDDYGLHGHNKTNQIDAFIHEGADYETAQQPSQALAAYRRAEKLSGKESYAFTVGIARTSQQLGDKTTAIKYYQKTVDLMSASKNAAYYGNDIEMYKENIKELEKAQ